MDNAANTSCQALPSQSVMVTAKASSAPVGMAAAGTATTAADDEAAANEVDAALTSALDEVTLNVNVKDRPGLGSSRKRSKHHRLKLD